MPTLYDELLERLTVHGQQHLLRFWDSLDPSQRAGLADEIRQLDLAELGEMAQQGAPGEDLASVARRAEGPPAIRLSDARPPFSPEEARRRGVEALRAGRVGALLVAGGQGSRLGFEHPKGMFSIGPISGASLYQILLEKIVATRDRYGAPVPLYLMTSPATHDETVAYLEAQRWFGLAPADVHVFCQGTLPALDAATGRVLLSTPGSLAASPDGHGGMLSALHRSGGLSDMARRGIAQLFYFQVDNPLATVCDPELIGSHLLAQSEYTLQVVAKILPAERLGVVASVDGRLRMIEYSDLPSDAAAARAADGGLKLWAGSIAVHVFDTEFLSRVAQGAGGLPLHRAVKKVPHVDDGGRLVTPSAPNAIKLERFIFDLLPHAARGLVVEAETAEAFAPVKNATGEPSDTPEAAQRQLIAQARRWLREAGVALADDVAVEISPRFALDAAQLAEKVARGSAVTRDTYFC